MRHTVLHDSLILLLTDRLRNQGEKVLGCSWTVWYATADQVGSRSANQIFQRPSDAKRGTLRQ